ncbi:MAG: thiamine pyrophosphate-dependent enzyme [archaeon]
MNEIKSLKDIPTDDFISGGSPTCAGCGPEIGIKLALKVLGKDTVIVNPAGCMTLLCNYPFTPLRVSWIHSAIENSAPTATGILAGLRARNRKMNVMCYAGDGATYDIGFGPLSFAAMRNDSIIYICYNNECYGNTGNQWDTATPYLASTTTTPPGERSRGNTFNQKDMVKIMSDHGVYAATANIAFPADYMNKVRKAAKNNGFSYIELLGTCPTNWHADPSKTVEISRLAVETAFWPLIEREKERLVINYKPEQLRPIIDFLKTQGRFSHLTKREVEDVQERVARRWHALLEEEKCGK